ncbi:MAG: hypothetical protein IRY98_00420 [Alicyclobacillaceae bacterium]|nr:hypothetical protein [Alicyclobacillaceae bacterium]
MGIASDPSGVVSQGASWGSSGAVPLVNPKSQLGKDAFLQLLVAQLKNQDPLQPLQNTEFISQLAQFSALEQLTNLVQNQSQALFAAEIQAASEWVGKSVTYLDDQGNQVHGTVQAVQVKNGTVFVNVDGKSVEWDSVVEIAPAATPPSGE